MGSRVLSRSFTLSKEEEEHDHENENDVDSNSAGSAMNIDGPLHKGASADDFQEGDNEEEGEDEEETEVVMVPLADILNARYNTENVQSTNGFVGICISDWLTMFFSPFQVKLFYEPKCLKMVATRSIRSGEQIVRLH